jgi:hypothetical protein
MSDDPARPGSPDSLHGAGAADVSAHGAFDDMASDTSPLLWADTHRLVVATGLATAAAVGVTAARLIHRT